jgi:hypothetical protein
VYVCSTSSGRWGAAYSLDCLDFYTYVSAGHNTTVLVTV